MASPNYTHARQCPDKSATVERLLLRYPQLTSDELQTLITLFPTLPMIDMALMTADARLDEPLAAFHRDHGHIFNAPVKTLVLMMAIPFLAVGLLWIVVA